MKALRIGLVVLGVGICLLSGCTHSSLYVESNPPGAELFFDGKPQGNTPVEFDFKWYGGHKIKLRKAGYEELVVIEEISAPLHYRVPFDLVTEVIPTKIADRQSFSYALVPLSEPPLESSH